MFPDNDWTLILYRAILKSNFLGYFYSFLLHCVSLTIVSPMRR